MTRNPSERPDALPDEIRRQFRSPGTVRFLRAIPELQADDEMPDHFRTLLMEMDRAESRQGSQRSGN